MSTPQNQGDTLKEWETISEITQQSRGNPEEAGKKIRDAANSGKLPQDPYSQVGYSVSSAMGNTDGHTRKALENMDPTSLAGLIHFSAQSARQAKQNPQASKGLGRFTHDVLESVVSTSSGSGGGGS